MNGRPASAARRSTRLRPAVLMSMGAESSNYGLIRDHSSSSRIGLHLAPTFVVRQSRLTARPHGTAPGALMKSSLRSFSYIENPLRTGEHP
jgi:hypothetical protein